MAGIGDLRQKAKSLWIRGMKTVGNTAESIASNTRFKVDEMTLQNRRRELLSDLARNAYALWLKGEAFPEQLTGMLTDLRNLDDQLNDMRAAKYSMSEKPDSAAKEAPAPPESTGDPAGEDPDTAEPVNTPGDSGSPQDPSPAPEVLPPIPQEGFSADTPLSVETEINAYFDSSSVREKAEKVNSSLNQLSEKIQNFSSASQPDSSVDSDS